VSKSNTDAAVLLLGSSRQASRPTIVAAWVVLAGRVLAGPFVERQVLFDRGRSCGVPKVEVAAMRDGTKRRQTTQVTPLPALGTREGRSKQNYGDGSRIDDQDRVTARWFVMDSARAQAGTSLRHHGMCCLESTPPISTPLPAAFFINLHPIHVPKTPFFVPLPHFPPTSNRNGWTTSRNSCCRRWAGWRRLLLVQCWRRPEAC
jgi:hypothetical protein